MKKRRGRKSMPGASGATGIRMELGSSAKAQAEGTERKRRGGGRGASGIVGDTCGMRGGTKILSLENCGGVRPG